MNEQQIAKLIEQARLTISAAGHNTQCGFSRCTCGMVEKFKSESGEFWRQIREYDELRRKTKGAE